MFIRVTRSANLWSTHSFTVGYLPHAVYCCYFIWFLRLSLNP